MKEQYVGDVNDYRKYALLRHLGAGRQLRIGVCWMLTPPDAGNLRHYLEQPAKWRAYDPDLYDRLGAVVGQADPGRLLGIEQSGIIGGACFFNEPLTDKADRYGYFQRALAQLEQTDLI